MRQKTNSLVIFFFSCFINHTRNNGILCRALLSLFLLSFTLSGSAQRDSAILYQQKLKQATTEKEQLNIYSKLAFFLNRAGQNDEALRVAFKGEVLGEKLKDSVPWANCLLTEGYVYAQTLKTEKSIAVLIKAEKLAPRDKFMRISIYTSRGILFYYNKDYVHAMEFFRSTERILGTIDYTIPKSEAELASLKTRVTTEYGYLYLNIGNIYFDKYQPDSSLYYYQKSQKAFEAIRDTVDLISTKMNTGNVYCSLDKNKEAKEYLADALFLAKQKHLTGNFPILYYNLAGVEFNLKEMEAASDHLDKSIEYAKHDNNYRDLLYCYKLKSRVDSSLGRKDDAYKDLRYYIALSDSVQNVELFNKVAEMQTKFDVEKKDGQIKLLNAGKALQDERLHRQFIISIIVIIALLIFCGLSVVLFRNVMAKKRANRLLEIQKQDIETKRAMLAEKNEKISDSIHYAQRLQDAILPAELLTQSEAADYFLYYLPKDTVSGDFYWRFKEGDQLFIAALDCTGHGVPGAMMSMLGYDLLENAVKEKHLREPSDILNLMNARIIEKLYKSNPDGAKDGMDMTLCRINLKTHEICCSGAKNSLYVVSAGEIKEYPVDKFSIGFSEEVHFTQFNLKPAAGDCLYMFSDGYADQKGGPENKKFMTSRFRKLLASVGSLSMADQKKRIQMEFENWKGLNSQRDDVLVVGFRLE